MNRSLPIAILQLDAAPAALTERLERSETLVIAAAQAGARLVVLPELFNTGYAYRPENFSLAEPGDGPTVSWMKAVSARLGIHLAGSLLLREAGNIYNALMLFAPDGRSWRYDKTYPWGWERAYFYPGHGPVVAETDLGAIGLMLCWDMAHADLWRSYAGCVDLVLACSCPPDLTESVYHFPDGAQVTAEEMGPVFGRLRGSAELIFACTPAQQAAWMGVPFASSTACGAVRTSIPNPLGSFVGLLATAPWLARFLPQAREVEVSAKLVEAGQVLSAQGTRLEALRREQGDAFALAEINLPAERPQPRGSQPRPPVPWFAYLLSDHLLTAVSRGTYARGTRK